MDDGNLDAKSLDKCQYLQLCKSIMPVFLFFYKEQQSTCNIVGDMTRVVYIGIEQDK